MTTIRERLNLVTITNLAEELGMHRTTLAYQIEVMQAIPAPKIKRGSRWYYTRQQADEIKNEFLLV